MDPCDSNLLLYSLFRFDLDPAILTNGLLKLRNLVPLGEVWIKIIFSGKDRSWGNTAVSSQSHPDDEFDVIPVENGEDTGVAETDRAGI
jgi:hypothetical protein